MSGLGGKCYEKQIEADLKLEPVEVCDCNKRKKCDSYYIQINKSLRKEIKNLMIENINLKYKLEQISELVLCKQIGENERKKIIEVIYDENN